MGVRGRNDWRKKVRERKRNVGRKNLKITKERRKGTWKGDIYRKRRRRTWTRKKDD